MSRADLEKQPYDVATMFDGIAQRYDLMNDIAAMGQVGMWRDLMVQALEIAPGDEVLDLAAGTGTSTTAIARAGARVAAADFSLGMMSEGRRRGAPVPFIGADAQRLPFAEDSFDAAVISFGLRNVHEPRRALAEMVRVVRPGGRVVVCEFSTPSWRPFRTVYEKYLLRALPAVAGMVTTTADAYEYLAESILEWPDQEALRGWFLAAGMERAQYRNLSGGIVALHRGVVPVS
ncbi:2-heptaprenyl-1,4-naphthoquinone methyltransferase [Brachybacterium faecium]|uniref:Demethylmenaquinone methyltransferase n=1 Tax=Brachybacterium faecium (strain ATCC 43885 / DSM 4810 / JCM 11609 / LMG 19847 / NBRC 14762 / NCIMB 9860 / 6-10) TaxID=446465 RepID=C7MC87_BRAFD|nr:demethylmenaquinone methyltransferase [Brachybacterium faecium]ACU85194.1 2-octaprenyl-6-methoxy-1,4-benzoquinone methylase /demethylmenaquinone methyltransferase [Brachybacterium faecium DSM 4810]SLN02750.1 2-heptaprenyl-1,4-naphthoquinone methyltransferase [Brachybacterium faecium]HJG51805.1 demethylmenaquinone methyltransferase [Brachybacterium faecium]